MPYLGLVPFEYSTHAASCKSCVCIPMRKWPSVSLHAMHEMLRGVRNRLQQLSLCLTSSCEPWTAHAGIAVAGLIAICLCLTVTILELMKLKREAQMEAAAKEEAAKAGSTAHSFPNGVRTLLFVDREQLCLQHSTSAPAGLHWSFVHSDMRYARCMPLRKALGTIKWRC